MKSFLPILGVMLTSFCMAQTSVIPQLVLEDFAGGFSAPIDIQNAGDDLLYVVEQGGKIKVVTADGSTLGIPFLDITDRVLYDGEQGLLGLAFHPNYAENGYFYVNYVNKSGKTVIARYSRNASNPHKANKSSEMQILKIPHPFTNHYAGTIGFGPDGYLYISMGDGGSADDPNNNAQNPGLLLGKMMRIDVDGAEPYTIPPTNPFVGMAGFRPEIWAIGLRNPFKWSFDQLTGDLWIGDVGQNLWEEVNRQPASSPGGENYGWDCKEGTHGFEPGNCTPGTNFKNPLFEYMHDGFDCTVIGGYVYRGSAYPNMYGKYIFNDYCSGLYRTIFRYGGELINAVVAEEGAFEYVTFGVDVNGELYTADIEEGEIFHIIDVSEVLKTSASLFENNNITLYPNPNTGQFTIEWMAGANEKSIIEIDNLMGAQMVVEKVTTTDGLNTLTVSDKNLISGTYILVINTGTESMRKTFIIE
ncbi:MAG: PQQ-dependent sugar dehydrogenase [Fimbriimonadaceae bacterium]|nr:PQQ-dependent sugar dehydrogenase [Chitinophagales bacterium]